MRYFLKKLVTIELDKQADGSVTKVEGTVLEVDGTGVTLKSGDRVNYYQWTRVAEMYLTTQS